MKLKDFALEMRDDGMKFQEIAARLGATTPGYDHAVTRLEVLRALPDEDIADNRARECTSNCCKADDRPLHTLNPEQLLSMQEEGELEEFFMNGRRYLARHTLDD